MLPARSRHKLPPQALEGLHMEPLIQEDAPQVGPDVFVPDPAELALIFADGGLLAADSLLQ